LLEPIPALSFSISLNLERRNPALGGGVPTGASRIGDIAVLKYRPTETLPVP
jgi:hypothetical protein